MAHQNESMLLTHVLEDENPLGRVAAIVSLQEEILRLKDKCEEAAITQQESEEELQNLRSKHANTVSELVKQRSVNSDLQEKLCLLEGLLQSKIQQNDQLKELIQLHRQQIQERQLQEQSPSAIHPNIDLQPAAQQIRLLREQIQAKLVAEANATRTLFCEKMASIVIEIAREIGVAQSKFERKLATKIEELVNRQSRVLDKMDRLPIQSRDQQRLKSRDQQVVFLKNKIKDLEIELINQKESKCQIDCSLSKIAEVTISKLKQAIAKLEMEKKELAQENSALKAKMAKGVKSGAKIKAFISYIEQKKREEAEEEDRFLSEYEELRMSLLQKQNRQQNQDYGQLIRQFYSRKSSRNPRKLYC